MKTQSCRLLDIPESIFIDILSRLSPIEIIHGCCTCKTWNNSISDPEFITLQFSRTPTYFLINNLSSSPVDSSYFSLIEFEDHPDLRHRLPQIAGIKLELKKTKSDSEMNIVGIINGFVCICEKSLPIHVLYIWNPITGEFIKFEAPEIASDRIVTSYGFGLSSKKGEYKVVQICQELLNVGRSSAHSHRIRTRLSTAAILPASLLCNIYQAMGSGVFCGSYGGIVTKQDRRRDGRITMASKSPWESRTTYHRRTSISAVGRGLSTVKCSESSWIAVHGKESMCIVTWDIAEEKSEKPDLFEIFSYPSKLPRAEVSVTLGTNEVCVGNCFADSFAEYKEILAINYLEQKLMKEPDLTYAETLQIAISAFGLLFPGNINANEIKICVGTKNESRICKRLRRKSEPSRLIEKEETDELILRILPITEVAAVLNPNRMANQGSENNSRCEPCDN